MSFRETYDQEKAILTIKRAMQEYAYNKSLFFQPKTTIMPEEIEQRFTPKDKKNNSGM